jgi:hypothetical protein
MTEIERGSYVREGSSRIVLERERGAKPTYPDTHSLAALARISYPNLNGSILPLEGKR